MKSLFTLFSLTLFSSLVHAEVVVTSATDDTATASVDDDLLHTALASTTWPTNQRINNGTTGAFSDNDATNPAHTTGGGTFDFILDVEANPAGYDIAQINSYSGWNDGRAGQSYTISFSTVGDDSFTQITPGGSGNDAVSVAASGQSLVTSVFDNTGALLGSGVDIIRFEVGVNDISNVWREIDVLTTPSGEQGPPAISAINVTGDIVTLTWDSTEGAQYTVSASTDLQSWDIELGNLIQGASGENQTSESFNLSNFNLEGTAKLFLRVEVNPVTPE